MMDRYQLYLITAVLWAKFQRLNMLNRGNVSLDQQLSLVSC